METDLARPTGTRVGTCFRVRLVYTVLVVVPGYPGYPGARVCAYPGYTCVEAAHLGECRWEFVPGVEPRGGETWGRPGNRGTRPGTRGTR
eukprot:2125330-Rhodomonas_salina.3